MTSGRAQADVQLLAAVWPGPCPWQWTGGWPKAAQAQLPGGSVPISSLSSLFAIKTTGNSVLERWLFHAQKGLRGSGRGGPHAAESTLQVAQSRCSQVILFNNQVSL